MKKFLAGVIAAAAVTCSAFAQQEVVRVAGQDGITIDDKKFKSIQIVLKDEELVFQQNEDETNQNVSIEITSNYPTAFPLISTTPKAITITQKDKTNKMEGRVCTVTVSVPKNFNARDMKIQTGTTDITLANFDAEKLDVSSESGKIDVSNMKVKGAVSIANKSADIIVSNLTADKLDVSSDSGKIDATKIETKGAVSIGNKGTDVTVDTITADKLDVSSDSGKIDVKNVETKGAISIGNKGADINVENLTGKKLDLSSDKGNATGKKLSIKDNVSIKSASGDLNFSGVEAKDITADSKKGKNVAFDDVRAEKIAFNVEKGGLDLALRTMVKNDSLIQVGSGKSNITLPDDATFYTSTSISSKGHFRSEFTQDSDGPQLEIKVNGGDLLLKKN